ncbi:MAG: mobile mystery protein B [Candidatus Omnitrophica bacterium]|nr:mobile mystery protein B [Candidatus Omnitrophota bacterium]
MNNSLPMGATPLSEEEKEGLLLTHITNKEELNRWEQENINLAIEWCLSLKNPSILSITFILQLHKKMFNTVWSWAGTFRASDKNIGVQHWQISTEIKKLLDDIDYWRKHNTFSKDEVAARLHHRLVAIHPFPNGNGRHGRLFTDLAQKYVLKTKPFTWGAVNLTDTSPTRKNYIDSLKEADRGNYLPLLKFLRS